MDKMKMQTANKADKNFKKLAELFPNAVTETIDENGEVVRAIDKDVLMQEISCKAYAPAGRKAWTSIPRKISTSRVTIWRY